MDLKEFLTSHCVLVKNRAEKIAVAEYLCSIHLNDEWLEMVHENANTMSYPYVNCQYNEFTASCEPTGVVIGYDEFMSMITEDNEVEFDSSILNLL